MFLQTEYEPNIHQRWWYKLRSKDLKFHGNQTLTEIWSHFRLCMTFKMCNLTERLRESLNTSNSWMQWNVFNYARQNFHSNFELQ